MKVFSPTDAPDLERSTTMLKLVKEVIVTTVELAEVHGRDFSELVQALLDQWLSTEGRYDEAS